MKVFQIELRINLETNAILIIRNKGTTLFIHLINKNST